MAVEIKEIVVKAIIAGKSNEEEADHTEAFPRQQVQQPESSEISQEALIQTCVDQVLKVLQKRYLR